MTEDGIGKGISVTIIWEFTHTTGRGSSDFQKGCVTCTGRLKSKAKKAEERMPRYRWIARGLRPRCGTAVTARSQPPNLFVFQDACTFSGNFGFSAVWALESAL